MELKRRKLHIVELDPPAQDILISKLTGYPEDDAEIELRFLDQIIF